MIDTAAVPLHGLLTLVVAVVGAGPERWSGSSLRLGWLVWLGIVVAVIVGLIDGPRRYHTLVVAPDRRSVTELMALSREPLRLVGVVASCVVLAVAGGCGLLAAAHAFGASPATGPALLVGLVLAVVVVVSPTPDGAGLVEAVAVVGPGLGRRRRPHRGGGHDHRPGARVLAPAAAGLAGAAPPAAPRASSDGQFGV